jgi:hypothetical protein
VTNLLPIYNQLKLGVLSFQELLAIYVFHQASGDERIRTLGQTIPTSKGHDLMLSQTLNREQKAKQDRDREKEKDKPFLSLGNVSFRKSGPFDNKFDFPTDALSTNDGEESDFDARERRRNLKNSMDPSKTTNKNTTSEGFAMRTGWTLPEAHYSERTTESIRLEFKRLDIVGEGRLKLLQLKTALELKGVSMASDHRCEYLLMPHQYHRRDRLNTKICVNYHITSVTAIIVISIHVFT